MNIAVDDYEDPSNRGICGYCGEPVAVEHAHIAAHGECPGNGSTPLMQWIREWYAPGGPHNAAT